MDKTTWKRAKQVFQEAIEKTGPERASFVDAACAHDRDLLSQVQTLLAAHDEAGDFMSAPTVTDANDAAKAALHLPALPD